VAAILSNVNSLSTAVQSTVRCAPVVSRVVDTVVDRAIVMVIFCSVAAYKRLLAQWFFYY